MTDTIKTVLAVIGGLAVVLGFLQSLFTLVPKLTQARADFWRWAADKWKYKKFKKAAVKSDIESIVNGVVFSLQEELPRGWIKRVSIEWIEAKDIVKSKESEPDEILLRVRPFENQDHNIIHGVHAFFDKALFPATQHIIPNSVRRASVLLVSRRTVCDKKPFLKERFDKEIYEKAVSEDRGIINYFSRFKRLDNRGFFVSTFMRELHEIATKARFEDIRNKMDKEANAIADHIQSFIDSLGDREHSEESLWYREGPLTSYAFLLVAHAGADSKRAYVTRAIERQSQGIQRLYVLGSEGQKEFASYVISEIAKLKGYRLVEKFKLNNDYRANVGGVGALFTTEHYVEDETKLM